MFILLLLLILLPLLFLLLRFFFPFFFLSFICFFFSFFFFSVWHPFFPRGRFHAPVCNDQRLFHSTILLMIQTQVTVRTSRLCPNLVSHVLLIFFFPWPLETSHMLWVIHEWNNSWQHYVWSRNVVSKYIAKARYFDVLLGECGWTTTTVMTMILKTMVMITVMSSISSSSSQSTCSGDSSSTE